MSVRETRREKRQFLIHLDQQHPSFEMSFNDLERGTTTNNGSPSSSRPPRSDGRLPLYHAPPSATKSNNSQQQQQQSESAEFKKLADSLSLQIFKINANVSGIEKLINMNERDIGGGDWSKQV